MAYEETPEQERTRLRGWEKRALESQAAALDQVDRYEPWAKGFIVAGVAAGALAIRLGASVEAQTVVNQVAENGPAVMAAFGSAASFVGALLTIKSMEDPLATSTKSLKEARRRIANIGDLSL